MHTQRIYLQSSHQRIQIWSVNWTSRSLLNRYPCRAYKRDLNVPKRNRNCRKYSYLIRSDPLHQIQNFAICTRPVKQRVAPVAKTRTKRIVKLISIVDRYIYYNIRLKLTHST
jgi:hypothetical protein